MRARYLRRQRHAARTQCRACREQTPRSGARAPDAGSIGPHSSRSGWACPPGPASALEEIDPREEKTKYSPQKNASHFNFRSVTLT